MEISGQAQHFCRKNRRSEEPIRNAIPTRTGRLLESCQGQSIACRFVTLSVNLLLGRDVKSLNRATNLSCACVLHCI